MSGEFDLISDQQSYIMPPAIDTFAPATDFLGPNFAVSEYQLTMVDSAFTTAHVPLKLKKSNMGWKIYRPLPPSQVNAGNRRPS
jgi:hypothetical protein